MIIFDGNQLAAQHAARLRDQVADLKARGIELKIAAILFEEDAASQLYTRLKQEAAAQVGIAYDVYPFSLMAGTAEIEATLKKLNNDPTVTGIIIQKPYRDSWVTAKGIDTLQGDKAVRQAYTSWWRFLTSLIAVEKDVDGLHPQGKLLPATAKAILLILEEAFTQLHISIEDQKQLKIAVLGRSDIVGLPVFEELQRRGDQVQLLTRDDLQQRKNSGKQLIDFDIVISATGQRHLITGEMVKDNAIVIDVGEPRPDVEFDTAQAKAAFITPVPGGVGPMTVICLLENCVALTQP